ncbi:myb domain protein 88 [Striga hermonthica]|uniref:Myb domain protein 88 n=1 Tax=Striga hermonthica TaxID=68872 RepID=A0A9N7RBD5_STRHE|nr:myb domain protein 88 [Striga hermonthica]
MKKKKKVNNESDQLPKLKERHIVSWSQEEDDILREQIRVHGTENWTIIASKFKDKTTRQCRRRWFTYLNSDFKKGGWSPEEDLLLCEAQKIFGNRWTEIAKVVSGRTDNAVKNRFTTLCKKRAKHEALAKENSQSSYINLNNKRVIFPNGGAESTVPVKKMRAYFSSSTESREEKLGGESGLENHLLRSPFAVIAENVQNCDFKLNTHLLMNQMEASIDKSKNNEIQGTFLKKDDPKVLALLQQAELLSSLAIKVNLDKTDQSLESAWKALQDFLRQTKGSELVEFGNLDTDIQLEKLKELVDDLRSSTEGSRPSWREDDVYESSPASSEYSTGSTMLPNMPGDKMEDCQAEICVLNQDTEHEFQSNHIPGHNCLAEETGLCSTASTNAVNILTCDGIEAKNDGVCEYSDTEFRSPVHVTPLFRAVAAAIPSPKFSESEKHFLMKTLGMDLSSPTPVANPYQHRACKRSLLHCL